MLKIPVMVKQVPISPHHSQTPDEDAVAQVSQGKEPGKSKIFTKDGVYLYHKKVKYWQSHEVFHVLNFQKRD